MGLGPGNPLFELGRPVASGIQSSFPVLVDFGPETCHPGAFGHYYYNVFVWKITIWPVKRCHMGIFHVGMSHNGIFNIGMCHICIGGWGVSPNREISMAPVSVMPRLGFWSSISAPRAGAGRATLFSSLCVCSLCARVLRKQFRSCSYVKGF